MTRCALAALLLACLGLSACGKVGGETQAGPPEDINYPKTYPTQ